MAAADVLIKELELTESLTETQDLARLIVWNDEVNTFAWVIQSLVEVCGHSLEQAEQCTYIIHFKGKYPVKKGSFKKLRPMQEALLDRGIGATIEG